MACTIPKWFGLQKWFEARFADLCNEHDTRYVLRDQPKVKADFQFAKSMWNMGYHSLAILSFIVLQSPYAYWLWYKD